MNQKQLNEFVNKNDVHQQREFFNTCLEKLKSLNKRCNQITLYGMILGIIFCLSINTKIQDIEVGIFKVSDLSIFRKLTPLIFSYLLLEWYLTSSHRYRVRDTLISLSTFIYSIPDYAEDQKDENECINELLPFIISDEITKRLMIKRPYGPIGFFFMFLFVNWISISFLSFSIIHSFDEFKLDIFTTSINLISIIIFLCLYFMRLKSFNQSSSRIDKD